MEQIGEIKNDIEEMKESQQSASTSPYINTILESRITLYSNQIDNDMDKHLKTNLEKRLKNKCYKNFGYIMNIYKLVSKDGGLIEAENPNASVVFNVKFACRICIPVVSRHIIFQIESTRAELTAAINGPIRIILTRDRINANKFVFNNNGLYVKVLNGMKPLIKGDFVKIKIEQQKFNNNDTVVLCMGFLEDMATEEEIEGYKNDEYNISGKFIDYEKQNELEDKKYDKTMISEGEIDGGINTENVMISFKK